MIEKQVTLTDTNSGKELSNKRKRIDVFNEEGYLFWANKYFRKQFADVNLSDYIGTGEDFRRVHILAEKIYKNTNTISIRESVRKVRPADIEDISMLIGLNIRRSKEFIARMVKAHVIALRIDRVGDTISEKYVVNPIFFFSAKRLSPDLYFLFQESLDTYLHPNTIQEFHVRGNIVDDIKKPIKKERTVSPLLEKAKAIVKQ
ncbi:MAG: hypothetical protein WC554_15630 [Clostridia bacterium]